MTSPSLAASFSPLAAGFSPLAGALPTLADDAGPIAGALNPHSASSSDFRSRLEKQIRAAQDPQKQADDAAAGLVSQALILPILQQVRRSTFNQKGPFSPGIAEKSFGPEFDMQLADRIAHSPQMGVTRALAARLLKKTGMQTAPKGATEHEAISVHG